MFNKITPTTDSQLSNEDVANLIVNDALNKISRLTGLSEQQAFLLLSNQIKMHNSDDIHEQVTRFKSPLLEQSEYQFISNLFNSQLT
ncbi:hypothetical protein [Colwellia piezophila]|uniref:hypothetical protein n=1 Tax=Colwellia piezophila TaxID=211668 RepID=UPI000379E26D|nr:hypothetical protein [Colwellia piezophila]